MNLLCAAGAFIPCPFMEGKELRVLWQPFRGLPLINRTLDALAAFEDRMLLLGEGKGGKGRYAGGRSVVELRNS